MSDTIARLSNRRLASPSADNDSCCADRPDENKNDDMLMLRIADGDQAAFADLVRRHSTMLYRIAYRILFDSHEAEDILQQVFSKLWQEAPNWKSTGGGLAAWLKRVTINQAIDRYRKVKLVTDGKPRIVSSDHAPEPVDSSTSAHRHLEMQEFCGAVESALNELPVRHRTAIILSYYEGYTNPVSAEILGLNLKAMESLLVRARENMRKLLIKRGIIGADSVVAL